MFVNGTEIYKFKAKDFEVVVDQICLGNISKDWSVDHMNKIRFTGYVYDFSVDYDPIAVDYIKDIHTYLMKKNNIVRKHMYKNVCIYQESVSYQIIISIKLSKYNHIKLPFNE